MTSMDNGDGQGRTANNDTTYCGFQVGQHVVCVNAEEGRIDANGVVLEKGKVYTIHDINAVDFDAVAVQLEEVAKTYERDGEIFEGWFGHWRFRPLQKLTPEQFVTTDAPVDERRAVLA